VTDCMERHKNDIAGAADEDLAFLSRFENCQLAESEWTHIAHIRVAWICLTEDTPEKALQRICTGILRYNTEVLHRPHKYHETVTVAFARIVVDRMLPREPWREFSARIDDILDPSDPVLLKYYSEKRLFSEKARQQYVTPDKEPLPEFAVAND
jgi:hypothetical protein